MRRLIAATKRVFTRNGGAREEGATLAEYCLLLFLITVALIGVIGVFGTTLSNVFSRCISVLS